MKSMPVQVVAVEGEVIVVEKGLTAVQDTDPRVSLRRLFLERRKSGDLRGGIPGYSRVSVLTVCREWAE
jgi:hypothetical protein